MSGYLHFVEASTEEHFQVMSHIHAMGWRDTYIDAVPAAWMAREVRDDRWTPVFRENARSDKHHGLLLYRGEEPVSCLNYCAARPSFAQTDDPWRYDNRGYEDWGEISSFYTHPAWRGRGYGGLLFEEVLRRLKAAGYENAFVFVLRENEGARRFYAAHGFAWDGTVAELPFPPDTVCVDLRYCKKL